MKKTYLDMDRRLLKGDAALDCGEPRHLPEWPPYSCRQHQAERNGSPSDCKGMRP